jgi:hypothetical protein
MGGFWFWKCHAGCGDGDEIMFLGKLKGLSLTKAMNLYLDLAGFPPRVPRKSHEYPESRQSHRSPESHESPKSLGFPVSPVSNGQGLGAIEKVLRRIAERNACKAPGTARERLWQLLRDLKAVEKGIGWELNIAELMPAFDEWYSLSFRFLDQQNKREHYLAEFIAGLAKVRVPTGEGDILNKALESVSKLSDSNLPAIPAIPDAPKSWRKLLALHRELSRRSGSKTYFLSYRHAAKVDEGLSHQEAHNVTGALVRLGVIKMVRKGKAGLNTGKAAEFRYLLSQSESPGDEDDEIPNVKRRWIQ